MANRVKCKQCDNMILEQTSQDNDGLCAPCFKIISPQQSPCDLKLTTPASQLSDREKRIQLEGAISRGNELRVKEMLSTEPQFVQKPPSEFHTWLGEAISNSCSISILEELLNAGCDPNSRAKSPDQTTVLEVAISNDQIESIQWLLENGADPNLGRPIIEAINFRKSVEIQLKMLTQLLDAGADVNQTFALYGDESERFTALDWAILYECSSELIDFLKARNAKQFEEL